MTNPLNIVTPFFNDALMFLSSFFENNILTPGSDLVRGGTNNQILLGRDGNDTLLAFNPSADEPDRQKLDLFIGDIENFPTSISSVIFPSILDPIPRNGKDRFILGDWQQPYYVNSGFNDLALIYDFEPIQDSIVLHGTPQDYQLVETPVGTGIFWRQGIIPEPLAFLYLVSDLSLEGDFFEFEGDTPPEGPVLGKTQQLGTVGADFSISSAADPEGNVYLVGITSDDLGGTNAGEYDAWVAKYDSDGNQVWIEQFGTSSTELANRIATDNDGNFYLTGMTGGDLGATKQGENTDAWVVKYDSDGNRLWIRQFGSDFTNTPFGIDVDEDGNVYLSGVTVKSNEEEAAFPVQDDSWVTKYDSDGNREWFREFGTPTLFDEAYDVAVDGDGNVYATGWTLGDLGGTKAGAYDAWLVKYDNDGNQEWSEQFGSAEDEFPWGVETDSQGNIYATGWTKGDLGGPNAGSYDAWVAKYDSDGNQVWIEQFGTNRDDGSFVGGMEVDSNDNIFAIGYTDGNLGGENVGSYDAWVAKYDSNGKQEWIKQFGTPELDYATDVGADISGNLYVTGFTEGSLGRTNAGSIDAWVAKLDVESGTLKDFSGNFNGIGGQTNSLGVEENQLLTTDVFTSHNTELAPLTTDFDLLAENFI